MAGQCKLSDRNRVGASRIASHLLQGGSKMGGSTPFPVNEFLSGRPAVLSCTSQRLRYAIDSREPPALAAASRLSLLQPIWREELWPEIESAVSDYREPGDYRGAAAVCH